jgi:hypothetical protein
MRKKNTILLTLILFESEGTLDSDELARGSLIVEFCRNVIAL